MTKVALAKILKKHQQWIEGTNGGQRANLWRANLWGANLWRANLRRADLRGANLWEANLRGADLREADLRGANLWEADLREADLRRANLREADLREADLWGANLREADLGETIYENINWFAYIGIIADRKGKARAYKLINSRGEGIFQGGINYLAKQKFNVPKVDPNINIQCSYGINLATFQWCMCNRQNKTDRLLLMEFSISDAICPINSDGKFRVKQCQKIGECDWSGNLIAEKEGKDVGT